MRAVPLRSVVVLILVLATTSLMIGQVVTATLPVENYPESAAVNTSTNKIYVANDLCNSTPCSTPGTVTVIDGATNNTIGTVTVGISPLAIAVNSVTNKIFVGNTCGNDPTCQSPGTVTVVDGSTLTTSTVAVGYVPNAIAVNPVTNQIYVANECLLPGYPSSCTVCDTGLAGIITVINGSTLQTQNVLLDCSPYGISVNTQTNTIYAAVPSGFSGNGEVAVVNGTTLSVQSVSTGYFTFGVAVDATTNQIYATNRCGSDFSCQSAGTVTVIDGTTLNTQTVTVGYGPVQIAANPVTNNIYVNNFCGDAGCTTRPSMTVINGTTLATTTVPVCTAAGDIAADLEVNTVTNKVYLPCYSNVPSAHVVTEVDGVTNATMPIAVGDGPSVSAVNSVTNNIYVPNYADATVSVIGGATKLQFVAITPCRLVDTRTGNPIQGGTSQNFIIPQLGDCNIPTSAAAYSLNVTAVPITTLRYLAIWPSSQIQPVVSTMNSYDGRIKANAAVVAAGVGGGVNVYVTDTSDVILDIGGYFIPSSLQTYEFYPLTPCRLVDTRNGNGGPLQAGVERDYTIPPHCNVPSSAVAYSFNVTVQPMNGGLDYLTVWPKGETRPITSTLNAPTGTTVANAAIVAAGAHNATAFYAHSNSTTLILDVNGYFAPAGSGGLSLYPAPLCRVLDTRYVGNGQPFQGDYNPPNGIDVLTGPCAPPSNSQAFVLNATVVPSGEMPYLALWAQGEHHSYFSTLNAYDGAITSNMAIVQTTDGSIDAYAQALTQLILDISGYFAP